MGKRRKLLRSLRTPGRKNVRFAELESLAQYLGFTHTQRGSDHIFRHSCLRRHVFVGQPHGGRDFVREPDIKQFLEAVDMLVEFGLIEDPFDDDSSDK